MNISRQQQSVLEALAEFRYLTIPQMVEMNISKNADSLRNHTLNRLINSHRKAIKYHDFGWIPQRGRLARVYYLTHYGAEILAEAWRMEAERIEYPKGGIQFSSDYTHRMNFIDFHISFKRWAEKEKKDVDFFYSYFDKIGSQRAGNVRSTAKTRVMLNRTVYTNQENKPFIPDGLTKYQDGNKPRLVAIEIHNGTHSKRITHQLLDHLEAIQQGLFNEKFNHDTANFVLSVHENQSTLDSVKRRLRERSEFQSFLPLFLFNKQDQAKANFAKGWTLADGSKTALFP